MSLTLPVDEKGFLRTGTLRIHPALAPLLEPIDSVQPADWNYNNGDIEEIATSLEINGMFGVLRFQLSTRDLIMGNHTWMACKGLGAEYLPMAGLDVDDIEARRMAIADNETARLARPDPGQLRALLEQIKDANDMIGLLGTGVNDYQLDRLNAELEKPLDLSDLNHEVGWPTLSFTLPPDLLAAFREMTEPAENDRQRLEALMRAAGWPGV